MDPLLPVLHQAFRLADRAIAEEVSKEGFDVRPSHSVVLSNIDIATGVRATALAERASVTKQAIGEAISDLERKGFVRRVPDPTDGRAKLIQLTPSGRAVIEAAFEAIDRFEKELASRAGVSNMATTLRTLNILIEIVSDQSTE